VKNTDICFATRCSVLFGPNEWISIGPKTKALVLNIFNSSRIYTNAFMNVWKNYDPKDITFQRLSAIKARKITWNTHGFGISLKAANYKSIMWSTLQRLFRSSEFVKKEETLEMTLGYLVRQLRKDNLDESFIIYILARVVEEACAPTSLQWGLVRHPEFDFEIDKKIASYEHCHYALTRDFSGECLDLPLKKTACTKINVHIEYFRAAIYKIRTIACLGDLLDVPREGMDVFQRLSVLGMCVHPRLKIAKELYKLNMNRKDLFTLEWVNADKVKQDIIVSTLLEYTAVDDDGEVLYETNPACIKTTVSPAIYRQTIKKALQSKFYGICPGDLTNTRSKLYSTDEGMIAIPVELIPQQELELSPDIEETDTYSRLCARLKDLR